MATTVVLAAPRQSSADVITIDDGSTPGETDIPFTCSKPVDNEIWLPYMGFVYRRVEPFQLIPGDTIAFDVKMRPGDPSDLGFFPQLEIALAHASDPLLPFKPDGPPGDGFTIVAHAALSASPGNKTGGDFDLVFSADTPFSFPGGGLIIRVGNPQGVLAVKDATACLPVIVSDRQPNGTNRLVGTFKQEINGEYPWAAENTVTAPNVPYVQISWTRCGDGRVSGAEACDDGNQENTDACSNSCLVATCGDGLVQKGEECDNSANPDQPDPFCDSNCHLDAYAKGSGCSVGGGAGLVAVLGIFLFARRRRGAGAGLAALVFVAWAGPAHAQRKADGFRVDRFEMAPSVEDGLVVQDPGVLRHMAWSVNATLGFSNTVLRVVPRLSTDNGVDVVGSRLSAYLDFAIGLRDRFEINAAVPFAVAQSTESGMAAGLTLKEAGTSAVGDARVGGSVLLYGRRTGPQVGLAATVALPVGSRSSFTGDGSVGGEVMATGGFVDPSYRVIVNGGVRFRPEADYVTSDQGTEFIGRAGVVVPVANHRLMTSLEVDLMARASGRDAYKSLGSPILALLGARYHFPSGLCAGAGVGVGLTEAPGSPAVRTLLTVGYSPKPEEPKKIPVAALTDSDGDGILDRDDKCPSEPEDVDGFEDGDGCPDPAKGVTPDPDGSLTLEQVVTLPAPIEFKFDTAIMLPGAEVYLRQVLEVLQQHSEVLKLEIQGHTSSEGGHEYNIRLSNDRAQAVFKWLVDHGIDAQRLAPHGYGLTQPLAPNDSEGNRQKNRRVQFRLIDQTPGSAPSPLGSPPNAAPPATDKPTTNKP